MKSFHDLAVFMSGVIIRRIIAASYKTSVINFRADNGFQTNSLSTDPPPCIKDIFLSGGFAQYTQEIMSDLNFRYRCLILVVSNL